MNKFGGGSYKQNAAAEKENGEKILLYLISQD